MKSKKKEEIEIKIVPSEVEDKCEKCLLKKSFLKEVMKATESARKAQEYYLEQVKKVNETLAKYTKKIEELDKRDK